VTLTYAQSLDSSLALAPGLRTVLSGAQSKAMTHFLRSRHAAILVGAGTAVADDPGLNSRLSSGSGAGSQPRPVVLDPRARWAVHEGSKVIRHARDGKGLAPFVLVDQDRFGMELGDASGVDEGRRRVLESVGGRYIPLKARGPNGRFEWVDVLAVLEREGLGSVMIEGGGEVINSLLAPPGNGLVDSVIVTIAPTWLGRGGVVVSPPRMRGEEGAHATPVRLTDVSWCPFGEDVVLCGRILR
jgi:2,5-diamino-6-(ribosylamino)-4(3H)-pyrimidinone 5'-phosphate reductase